MYHLSILIFSLVFFVTFFLISCDKIKADNEIPVEKSLLKELDVEVGKSVNGKIEGTFSEINVESEQKFERESTDFDKMLLTEAFTQSVNAYLDENWQDCIDGFEHVIQSYSKYRKAVIECRSECRRNESNFSPIFIDNVEDLHFYEKKIRETLCLLKCNQDYRDIAGAAALRRLPRETEQKILDFKPYEYLHICYFQKNQFQDAANAIFTYLVLHPKHKISVENLRFYLTLPEVKESEVTNLEIAPFIQDFMRGVKAYEDEFWNKAVDHLENSLKAYIKTENECRIYCEGPFDQGWHPEFTSSIANHFAYCLKCKRSCSQYLNNINGDYQRDLLSSHYNYLQFAYYKIGDIKRSCQAVESYLLFFPADETMINNKIFYSHLPKVENHLEYFIPRKEAASYVKRQEYELRILKYISEEFAAIDARLTAAKKSQNSDEIFPN